MRGFTGERVWVSLLTQHPDIPRVKASEDCAICMCPMTSPPSRIRLGCGHYFHTGCLSRCLKSECPMCRKAIDPDLACVVFKDTIIRPIAYGTFALPVSAQPLVFDTIRAVNFGASMGAHYASLQQMLFLRFARAAKGIPVEMLGQAIDLFDGATAHAQHFKTFEGFSAMGDGHGIMYGSEQAERSAAPSPDALVPVSAAPHPPDFVVQNA